MRLVLKQGNKVVEEFQFTKGPVYIGRHPNSQIFLSDRSVSRQHAVIFSTHDGKWMAEDLDSANKTYLNDEEINKAEIKDGDVLRIVDFAIEISFEDEADIEEPTSLTSAPAAGSQNMEDTLITDFNEPKVIIRRLDSEHAPAMRIPAKKTREFVQATEAICKADGLDGVLIALLQIAAKQFNAYHAWCALRSEPAGPMTAHGGKTRSGKTVQLNSIKLKEKITEAVEQGQFLLFPRIPVQLGEERIQSAMIVPVMGEAGCFGVLYIDNDMAHQRYSTSDLDYLILIMIHTAAILENF